MAEPSKKPAATDDLCGRTIAGKYVMESKLGGGAMGAVYRAHQTALGRTVAIKVMRSELATDPSFVERFHREAKTASLLVHPNSINVTDFGEEADGLLYLVMEFAAGRNLDQIIEKEAPLAEARIVNLLSQTLSAVSVAHELGIVHRDLKPENILVVAGTDDEGSPIEVVKVCDFGVASMLGIHVDEPADGAIDPHLDHKLTAVGAVIGTPAYMSPEQATASPLDGRSDLYALGVVLFEMLTGRLPFEAQTHGEMLAAHTGIPAPSPLAYRATDPRLAQVCMTALQKLPDLRFPDARAMRSALRASLLGTPGFGSMLPPSSIAGATGRHPSVLPESGDRNATTDKPPMVAVSLPRPVASVTQTGPVAKPSRLRAFVLVAGVAATLGVSGLWLLLQSKETNTRAGGDLASSMPSPTASVSAPTLVHPAPMPEPTSVTTSLVRSAPSGAVVASAIPSQPAPAPKTAQAPSASAVPHAEEPGTTPLPLPALTSSNAVQPPASAVTAVATVPTAPIPTLPPVPSAPVFHPEKGSVSARVVGANRTSRAVVSSLLARVSFDDCYRDALRRLGHSEAGAGSIHLEIDEDGVIRSATATLPPALSSASGCVAGKLRGQRVTQPPDTGNATADIGLVFTSP